MATVVYDKEERLLKVTDPSAEEVAKFGASILYKFGDYNFHPKGYELLTKLDLFKFREDDVILTMFPKSGSTWLSECIFLIVNHYHYERASKDDIEVRFPQIDSPSHNVFGLIVDQLDLPTRRCIKSSVPPTLLIDRQPAPNYVPAVRPKVISILRNPRDVLVSFYHHCKTVKHYDVSITFNEFFDSFVEGKVPCGPIWKMYNDMYEYHRQNPTTSLMVFYEDMKRDLRAQIKRICLFLNEPQPANEDSWSQLLDHLSVERMRKNRTINRQDWVELGLKNPNGYDFVRKGQVNDWKNFFSQQQSATFDRTITDRLVVELRTRYGHQAH